MRVLFLLACVGCGYTVVPVCEDTPEPVGTADAGEFELTAEELVALAAGFEEVSGVLADGTPISLEQSVVRGEGEAVVVRSVESSERRSRFGFGVDTQLIAVICNDSLQVPVEVSLVGEAVEVEASGSLTLWSPDEFSTAPVTFDWEADWGTSLLPEPAGINPEEWEGDTERVSFEIAAGELIGEASWFGVREGEATVSASAVPVLEWASLEE